MSEGNAYLITSQPEIILFDNISKLVKLPLHSVDTSLIYNWSNLGYATEQEEQRIQALRSEIQLADPRCIVILHTLSYHFGNAEILRAKEISFLVREIARDIPIVMVIPSLTNNAGTAELSESFPSQLDVILVQKGQRFEFFASQRDAILVRILLADLTKILTVDGPAEAFPSEGQPAIYNLSPAQMFVDFLARKGEQEFLVFPFRSEDTSVSRRMAEGLNVARLGSPLDSGTTSVAKELERLDLGRNERILIYSRRITRLDNILALRALPMDLNTLTLCCTHLDLPTDEVANLDEPLPLSLVTTDSIASPIVATLGNVHILSLAPLLAETLERV